MLKKISKLLGVGVAVTMLASLLAVAVPAAALSQPQVSLAAVGAFTKARISDNNSYTITFNAAAALAAGDQIVVAFPPGGPNPTGTIAADVTLEALAGLGGGPIPAGTPATTIAVTGSNSLGYTLTIDIPAGQSIGAGSLVGIVIGAAGGIMNPATPGDYTLTVATQKPGPIPVEAAVTSNVYTINPPTIVPLPGIVLAYNSAGILMSQGTSIQGGINNAGVGGRVEVGAGTYDEAIAFTLATQASQTLIATGDPGTVIIQDADSNGAGGTITVGIAAPASNIGITIDGFTIKTRAVGPGVADMVTLNGGASYVTIQNCAITAGSGFAAINIAAAAGTHNAVKNSTITATGTTTRMGIVAANQVAVSDTTITVGSSATSQAVTSSAGTGALPTTLTNVSITGSSGMGLAVTAGTAKLVDSTIMTVNKAIAVSAGLLTVTGSTIDSCGASTAGGVDAVMVTGTGNLTMTNNTIKDTSAVVYAVSVAAGTAQINFNNITGNAKNMNNAVAVTADHNWWGSADGPASGSIKVTGGTTTTTPVLGNAVGSASLSFNAASLSTKTTIGVDVAGINAAGAAIAMDVVAVSKYSSNPQLTAPTIMGTGSVLGYYDVYVNDATAPVPTSIQIKFYGAVDQYTKVYYGGSIGGQWATPSSWGVNAAGGYVYVTVSALSSPTITDLGGLAFAVVEDKTVAPPVINTPKVGETNVSIMPLFTWNAVPGATRYELTVSDEPTFAIPVLSKNVDSNLYGVTADDALAYDTTYYWKVRAVLENTYTATTPKTGPANGIFTTMAKPVVAEPPATEPSNPVINVPAAPQPPINVTIPPTKITVEPATASAIPTYILWIIVVVGAVLIIALIVLIVRTRRA